MILPHVRHATRKTLKRCTVAGSFLLASGASFLVYADNVVSRAAEDRIHYDTAEMPRQTVLVLGTSKASNKLMNPYFKYRLEAALELYKQGKVEQFILSGDNHVAWYCEPCLAVGKPLASDGDMKDYLVQSGVPENVITLDYAGFRTLDSVVRAKTVFGKKRLTIVSQPFHLRRALYLADHHGISAIGYAAKDVGGKLKRGMRGREILARGKAVLDVSLLNTQPKFIH